VIDPRQLKPTEKPWDESPEDSRENCRRDGADVPHHAYYEETREERGHDPPGVPMLKVRLDRLWAWLGWA